MKGQLGMAEGKPFTIQDLNLVKVEEFWDGSRLDGVTAATTSRRAEYLGMHATVIDAEMLGVLLALEDGSCRIALDSQLAIKRLEQLYTQPPRS